MTHQVTTIESRDYMAARQILSDSIVHGGGTWSVDGEPVKSGVAVTTTILAKVAEITHFKITDAIEHLRSLVADPALPLYLGTWYDEENGVWEISQTAIFETREAAMVLASILDERYVYDITTDECLPVA